MLTIAALGMLLYGLSSVLAGVGDILGAARLEWWADLWLVGAGVMLAASAAFVRASMPGGLALAVGGLLALQSISLHNAGHLYGHVSPVPELARATFAVTLVALAYWGWSIDDARTRRDGDSNPPHAS